MQFGPDGLRMGPRKDELAPPRDEADLPPVDTKPVNRDEVCPMLVRCFWRLDQHHHTAEYAKAHANNLPINELQLHTWSDATLKELADLIKNTDNPGGERAKMRTARMDFAVVFPDTNGRYQMREVGRVFSMANGRPDDSAKTLASLRFQAGDLIDVSICGPNMMNRNFQRPMGNEQRRPLARD